MIAVTPNDFTGGHHPPTAQAESATLLMRSDLTCGVYDKEYPSFWPGHKRNQADAIMAGSTMQLGC